MTRKAKKVATRKPRRKKRSPKATGKVASKVLRPARIAAGSDHIAVAEAAMRLKPVKPAVAESAPLKPARPAVAAKLSAVGPSLMAITDASQHPWRSIAFLEITYETGTLATGTAFFIGPRALATAGHNIRHPRFLRAIDWRVTPAAFGHVPGVAAVPARLGFVPPNWGANAWNSADDWAVLTVDDPSLGQNYKWFALSEFDYTPTLDQAYVCGYANDFQPRAQYVSGNQPLKSWSQNYINYDYQTDDGMSGGPLFYYVKDVPTRYAIGIHIAEVGGVGRARRITPEVFDKLKQFNALR